MPAIQPQAPRIKPTAPINLPNPQGLHRPYLSHPSSSSLPNLQPPTNRRKATPLPLKRSRTPFHPLGAIERHSVHYSESLRLLAKRPLTGLCERAQCPISARRGKKRQVPELSARRGIGLVGSRTIQPRCTRISPSPKAICGDQGRKRGTAQDAGTLSRCPGDSVKTARSEHLKGTGCGLCLRGLSTAPLIDRYGYLLFFAAAAFRLGRWGFSQPACSKSFRGVTPR